MQNTLQAKSLECEKLRKVKDKSQVIGEFIDWLQEKKGIHLCIWRTENDLAYAGERTEKLLAEFFDIDLVEVEQERRLLLKEIRVGHAREAGDLKPIIDNL